MNKPVKQIAEEFSGGIFEGNLIYLREDCVWDTFGHFKLEGKSAIEKQCRQVAAYFESVTTDFEHYNTIVQNNKVAINGRATFVKDGKVLTIRMPVIFTSLMTKERSFQSCLIASMRDTFPDFCII